jgi:hypothetical protein
MKTDIRSAIVYRISNMLDHPDRRGIYPTTECYDGLEKDLRKIAVEAEARGMWFVFRDMLANDESEYCDEIVESTLNSLGIKGFEIGMFEKFAKDEIESDLENFDRLSRIYYKRRTKMTRSGRRREEE